MAKILRTDHFKLWVEKQYCLAAAQVGGMTEAQARDKFRDNIYEDFNLLHWIVDSIFPHTRRNGEDYDFITDNLLHTLISERGNGLDYYGNKITQPEFDAGQLMIKISNAKAVLSFGNPKFRHGHIDASGYITCYGTYLPFNKTMCKIGFSGALMDSYNFARVSRYGTKMAA